MTWPGRYGTGWNGWGEMTEKETLVEISSLVGKHVLSGVDMINRQMKQWHGDFEDCQCINFVLDGITYTAIEDPSDGYRSQLKEIIKSDEKMENNFRAVEVVISLIEKRERWAGYGVDCEILQFIDTANGKVILEVGTDNTDDYYPSFVSDWMPEKLSINEPHD